VKDPIVQRLILSLPCGTNTDGTIAEFRIWLTGPESEVKSATLVRKALQRSQDYLLLVKKWMQEDEEEKRIAVCQYAYGDKP
jgi:hypothetical protein